jgi:hypothetical protein
LLAIYPVSDLKCQLLLQRALNSKSFRAKKTMRKSSLALILLEVLTSITCTLSKASVNSQLFLSVCGLNPQRVNYFKLHCRGSNSQWECHSRFRKYTSFHIWYLDGLRLSTFFSLPKMHLYIPHCKGCTMNTLWMPFFNRIGSALDQSKLHGLPFLMSSTTSFFINIGTAIRGQMNPLAKSKFAKEQLFGDSRSTFTTVSHADSAATTKSTLRLCVTEQNDRHLHHSKQLSCVPASWRIQ